MAVIVKEFTIAAAPARVWGALTQPEEIGHWWTNDLDASPEAGSLAEFRFGGCGEVLLRFEVADLERNKNVQWMYTYGSEVHWAGTTVSWLLEPVQNGTKLVFTHDQFAQADQRYDVTRAWWEHFLASLKSYLETGKGTPGVPPFPS